MAKLVAVESLGRPVVNSGRSSFAGEEIAPEAFDKGVLRHRYFDWRRRASPEGRYP
jgi:hypothetical protein